MFNTCGILQTKVKCRIYTSIIQYYTYFQNLLNASQKVLLLYFVSITKINYGNEAKYDFFFLNNQISIQTLRIGWIKFVVYNC